jgi:hypothetical protein
LHSRLFLAQLSYGQARFSEDTKSCLYSSIASLASLRACPELVEGTSSDQSEEKSYWLSKMPYERLQAVELMRQIVYGYDPSGPRLQGVFEVTRMASGWSG